MNESAHQRLESLAQLPNNWDSYGAKPPNQIAIDNARKVLQALQETGLQYSSIDPSAENGICISFVNANKYADVECFNDGSIYGITAMKYRKIYDSWDVDEENLARSTQRIKIFMQG